MSTAEPFVEDFPEDRYLKFYSDVKSAVERGDFDSGLQHYELFGRQEIDDGLRVPFEEIESMTDVAPEQYIEGVDEIGGEFFSELYSHLNPDLRSENGGGSPSSLQGHWIEYGRKETADGKRPTLTFQRLKHTNSAATETETDGYSEYLTFYPELFNAIGSNPEYIRQHYLNHGRQEGRLWPVSLRGRNRLFRHRAFAEKTTGFNIFGPFCEKTGLGTAARSFGRLIKETGFPFELHSFRFRNAELELPAPLENGSSLKINLIIATCDQLPKIFAGYPVGTFDDSFNIALLHWELPSLRSDWLPNFSGIDEVWTTSKYQKHSFETMSPIPVQCIPLPIKADHPIYQADRRSLGLPEDALVFFTAFDMGSSFERKNPGLAISAFKKAFSDDNVHLVVKVNHRSLNEPAFRKLIADCSGVTNISVIAETLDRRRMDELIAASDVLVMTSRSEGFGLSVTEFMSMGKVVIATAYSGYLDYLDETTGYLVDYDLTEVGIDSGPYPKGAIWAEPREASLIQKMRHVAANRTESLIRGGRARETVASSISVEAISCLIKQHVDSMEFDHDVPAYMHNVNRAEQTLAQMIWSKPRENFIPPGRGQRLFSIVMPVYNVPGKYLEACLKSIFAQTYPLWELCICDDCSTRADTLAVIEKYRSHSPRVKVTRNESNSGISSATNRAVEITSGSFVVFVDNDDLLAPNALEHLAKKVMDTQADVVYTDEVKIDENGRVIDHFFKPDWSPEHLESVMYVMHLTAVRKSLLLELGGLRPEFDGAQDYDLMLRLSRATSAIAHVPACLYAWRAIPGSAAAVVDAKPYALKSGRRALEEHVLAKYGRNASVEDGLTPGTFRVRRAVHRSVPVSLLILTGNQRGDAGEKKDICYFENLIESIIRETDYTDYTIQVIDNSTLSEAQIRSLCERGVGYENFEIDGSFNFSEKANYAISVAKTEHIVLMNDDMEVIRRDWLTSLVELTQDNQIGAVGARLLHADGTIQHVGMFLGVYGSVTHPYHGYPREFVGYNGFTHLIRNFSVVTAACLATRRSVIRGIGGFDPKLAVDFNDVDLCMRIIHAGYRVVYSPYAELYHFESRSIKRDRQDPGEVSMFNTRWGDHLNDAFYNVNLTKSAGDMSVIDESVFDWTLAYRQEVRTHG